MDETSASKNTRQDLLSATHCLLMLLPTVIVCCHGNAGIAQASLLGKDDLWNSGHVDNISAPLAEHQTLSPRGEPGPLDTQHGSSGVALDPQAPRHLQQNLHRHEESKPSL